jgi:hypothetical protein
MEHSGIEWNGINLPFHYLDILEWNGVIFPLHCLVNQWNGMNYNFLLPFLPLSKNTII